MVAWVGVPDLTVQPMRQRYERLSAGAVRFATGAFAADLLLDGDGFVRYYPDLATDGQRIVSPVGLSCIGRDRPDCCTAPTPMPNARSSAMSTTNAARVRRTTAMTSAWSIDDRASAR